MNEGITEEALAQEWGITRKVLAKKRRDGLQKDLHWALQGNAVVISADGVSRLSQLLGLPKNTGVDTEKPAPAQEQAEGTVKKLYLNRHLLGVLLKDGEPALVRVRDQGKFKMNMAVPLVRTPGEDVWRLGRKEPRWPGRW